MHPCAATRRAGERFEVFHVRAENHRFACEDGLGGILAAGGEEAFPDDHHVGVRRPIAQFAGGVDEENVAPIVGRRAVA